MAMLVVVFIPKRRIKREWRGDLRRISLDQNDATHYCPISRLPHLGRLCSSPVLHIRSCRSGDAALRF